MERKKALAVAAAFTGVLGSTTVAMAAVGGLSLLGFGGGHPAPSGTTATSQQGALAAARVITRTKDVYDRVTVAGAADPTLTRAAGLASAVQPEVQVPGVPASPTAVPRRTVVTTRHHKPRSRPTSRPSTPATPAVRSTPTTTTEPFETPQPIATTTTTTTVPPVTTTTWPRGVPRDWPPGKPIPPMPPNCREPQLEDNGVWNCQG
jgi:hypothetical protein